MSVDAAQPSATVTLVTMEIRHPATDSLMDASRRELKRLLADLMPIELPAQDVVWALGANGSPTPTAEHFVRYIDRDATLAASIKGQAIAIETSAYSDFETLLGVAMRVVDARAEVSSIAGVERIGLRYIIEVRVPGDEDGHVEWAEWLVEPLLGPRHVAPEGLALTEWQGAAVYQAAGQGRSMIVRYGPGVGQALDPNYHLRRTALSEPGPFFMLDIDSFWAPVGPIPEFSGDAIQLTSRELFEPAQTAFKDMLSDRARDELFNP